MDPNSKLLLDEMKKLGDRFALVESRVDSLEGSLGDRFKSVEQSTNDLVAWKPGIDAAIADLTTKLGSVDNVKSQIGSLHQAGSSGPRSSCSRFADPLEPRGGRDVFASR